MTSSPPAAPALPSLAPLPPLVIGGEGKRQLARRLRQQGIGTQSKAQAKASTQAAEQATADAEKQATTESILHAVKVTVETAKEKEAQYQHRQNAPRAALAPSPTQVGASLPAGPDAALQLPPGEPGQAPITGVFRVEDITPPREVRQRVAEAGERARTARQALIPTRIEQAGTEAGAAGADLTPPPPAPTAPQAGRKPGHLLGPAYNAPANPQPEPYRGIGSSGPLPGPSAPQRPPRATRRPPVPPPAPVAPMTPPEPSAPSGGLLERMRAAGQRFREGVARHAPPVVRQRITWQQYERMFGERPAGELSDEEIQGRIDWIKDAFIQHQGSDRLERRRVALEREQRRREIEQEGLR